MLVLAPTIAVAQVLVDPTRPPAGLAAEAPEGAVAGNQLQSVMISPTRRAAIINGVVVELGGKYGDAVLTRVAEDEVVLRSGDSRQVLKLHPAVERVGAPREAKPKAKAQSATNSAADRDAGTR